MPVDRYLVQSICASASNSAANLIRALIRANATTSQISPDRPIYGTDGKSRED